MAGFRGFTRRDFLQMAGGSTVAVPFGLHVIEFLQDGSIAVQDHFIPVEKNLPRQWRDALFQRGDKEVWSGAELDSIGMPCGGIAAGQMYVRGDGTLGHWEVFNEHEFIGYGATNYAKRDVLKPVDHSIRLLVHGEGPPKEWPLDKTGFDDISFNGQYPVATV
ncbi:MAG: twin-arginine translocation signal domain-containing protein, partial [Armatimonadetes bacterium]|nr:twin-arginine translocation signal domain-containing protein [Armatimonadota bacterium]